jgi:anthranilate synthase component 1
MPLSRRLSLCPDPLDVFTAWTDHGQRPDTLLLESADVTTRQGERSLLVLRSAMRLEGRGNTVTAVPLSPNGLSIMPWLGKQLFDKAQVKVEQDKATFEFAPFPRQGSELERLKAPSPLDAVRALARNWKLTSQPAPLTLGVFGVFAYDLLEVYEDLPRSLDDWHGYPDFVFWLPEVMAVIHHRERSTTLLTHVFGGAMDQAAYADAIAAMEKLTATCEAPEVRPSPFVRGMDQPVEVDQSDEEYGLAVQDAKRHIVAGDVFQIVPSRTFRRPCPDPLAAYRKLRAKNPSPYMFYVRRKEDVLYGSSPETSVKVSGQPRRVEIRPIAGTRPRGFAADGTIDADLDSRLEAELRLDEKELAEHMMLVDLARNDVARVSVPGTRRVDRLLTVDRYSHVMHLVSYVSGELRSDLDALHAYQASMNMGTLVGAPKLKAAQLLRKLEATRRGPYGGAVGYYSWEGEFDTAIVIRSALVQNGMASVRAGAGVVYDSVPEAEAAETRRKAQAVLSALDP